MRTWPSLFFVTFAAVIICTSCGGSTPAPQSTAGMAVGATALDGSSFDIVLEMPGETPEKDTINFAGGKFESAVCTPLGFPKWTPYQTRAAGGATEFLVITRHPSGTTMDWKGSVRGDKVEGTVVRTLEGKVSTGPFKGNRRK